MTRKKSAPARLGVIMLVVTLMTFVVLFNKDRIATTLAGGDTIRVHFAQDYKLRPFVSKVKVGFVPVGRVSGVERAGDGGAVVSMKVERNVLERLGSQPTATIRPTTLLGGSYFVELQAGGDQGPFTEGVIPVERTTLPVELDKVARALQPDALEGLQGMVDNVGRTFDQDGAAALRRLIATAPDTLLPTGRVLDAVQGKRPIQDIGGVVRGLEATGRALTARDGQLDSILENLARTTATLDRRSGDLAAGLGNLPAALSNTNEGLRSLSSTLATLEDVSAKTRPVAKELRRTLDAIGPVLADARPVVGDLRAVVNDAQPVLANLVPTAQSARTVIGDVRGPVIDRVNGPVMDWLYAPYDGTGPYSMTESERPMYEETTFTFVNLDRASGLVDANGHAVAFQPGIGAGSVSGLPISLEQYLKVMTHQYYSPEPLETLPPVGGTATSLQGLLATLLGKEG